MQGEHAEPARSSGPGLNIGAPVRRWRYPVPAGSYASHVRIRVLRVLARLPPASDHTLRTLLVTCLDSHMMLGRQIIGSDTWRHSLTDLSMHTDGRERREGGAERGEGEGASATHLASLPTQCRRTHPPTCKAPDIFFFFPLFFKKIIFFSCCKACSAFEHSSPHKDLHPPLLESLEANSCASGSANLL